MGIYFKFSAFSSHSEEKVYNFDLKSAVPWPLHKDMNMQRYCFSACMPFFFFKQCPIKPAPDRNTVVLGEI